MTRKIALLILLAALLTVSPAMAGTEKLSSGLKVWYPDKWEKVYETDRLMVRSPDGAAIATFIIFKADDLAEAEGKMTAELMRIFGNTIKVTTDPSPAEINKLDGVLTDGTGYVAGAYTIWVSRVVVYKGKALMVLGCVATSRFSVYNKDIGKIISGVKT